MIHYSLEDIDSSYACDEELGVSLYSDRTVFRVWAPLAEAVEVNLYESGDEGCPLFVKPMTKVGRGVWQLELDGNADGIFYTYTYSYNGERTEGVDPYARAAGINGKRGCVLELSRLNPHGWEESDFVSLSRPTDAVIAETHVRDFSKNPSSGIDSADRGLFRAFTVTGSLTPGGLPSCLGHIRRMGYTHVHLLPIADYGRLDETCPEASYNWGYDPENYNLPEGSYSSDPYDPRTRILELKELVMSLHKSGIGVIMDVVYNHTFKLDGSALSKAFPGYYYRYKDGKPSNGSGCGNEIASERAMVRKYIVDSLCFWAREYKIDGFRFDLMAVLDIDTMNEVSRRLREINPGVLLYGEGWTGGAIALDGKSSASKANAGRLDGIAFFNDGYRDALKGETFVDAAVGYVSGNHILRDRIVDGLLGREKWADSPSRIVNYCEAHDNLTLWDKLAVSAVSCHERDRKKMARLAMALVLLAQGIPLLQLGQEFLRSKPLEDGGFDHNSYASPDSVNSLKWDMLDENSEDAQYIAGLIGYRKRHRLLRLGSSEEVQTRSYVADPSAEGTIMLRLFDDSEELLVLVNPISRAKIFMLPDGEWEVNITDCCVSESPLAVCCEGMFVPPISVMVLKRYRWKRSG